jgi:hypothetical protein
MVQIQFGEKLEFSGLAAISVSCNFVERTHLLDALGALVVNQQIYTTAMNRKDETGFLRACKT